MQEIASITWNKLYNDLFRFIHSKVKDKSIAEDIIQEVFIKVYTKAHQIKEPDKASSWIYRVANNEVTDHFRKTTKVLDPVNLDDDGVNNNLNESVAQCLKILMASLPSKYREALELTELENLSQHALAERLQISYSGARSRVQRARKMLKAKVDELLVIKTDSYGNVIVCENRGDCGCNYPC